MRTSGTSRAPTLLETFDAVVEIDRPTIDLGQNHYYWTTDDNESLDELLISGFQAVQAL